MNKVRIDMNKYILGLIALLGLVVSSCGTTAPFKSRDAALVAIVRSETVKAPLYAEKLHTSSKGDYEQGQELIVEAKKSAKNTQAKKFYISSKTLADEAYTQAIGPFTKAIIDATAVALEEAKVEKVHRASEDLYEQAVTENTSASSLLDEKEFSVAQESSLAARVTLQSAIEKTRMLKAFIAEQQKKIDELKARALQMKATNAVPEAWQSSVEFHERILMTFEEGYYLEVSEDTKELIEELNSLLALIEEKKQEAIRELAGAERTISQLKSHRVTIEQEISRLNKEYQKR